MNCDQATERFLMQLAGESDAAGEATLAAHLAACAECREATAGLAALWADLGRLPEERPSPMLQVRFDAMLTAYRQGARRARSPRARTGRLADWIAGWWPARPAYQMGLVVLLLALGFGFGSRLDGFGARRSEMEALRQEVQSTRALVALSLLQQRSPADRLQGVTWSARAGQPDAEVLQALFATLDGDPSVNVRLAVVDALAGSATVPRVQAGLLVSLPRQTSPLVQIALIDVLARSRALDATDLFRRLADDAHLDATVRQRARWGSQQLTS